MATTKKKTSKIQLPLENSRRYQFNKELELEIGYNSPITQEKYDSMFGGNER